MSYISSVVVWHRVRQTCFARKSSLDCNNLLAPSTTLELCRRLLLFTVDGMGVGRGNSGNTVKQRMCIVNDTIMYYPSVPGFKMMWTHVHEKLFYTKTLTWYGMK